MKRDESKRLRFPIRTKESKGWGEESPESKKVKSTVGVPCGKDHPLAIRVE